MTKKLTYASAGVSLDRWEKTYKRMRRLADATRTKEALSKVGAFGLFQIPRGLREPVLVASTDGVGTKLKIAFLMRRHDTVGEDLVNHCINDILVQGARPLFFLDYMACGKLKPSVAVDVVKGFARACKREGITLLGGETAEMPGFYAPGEYDLAGFVVGVVEQKKIITGARIRRATCCTGFLRRDFTRTAILWCAGFSSSGRGGAFHGTFPSCAPRSARRS
jgi:phosphoribosylformylglycinamidine cyclo-ligase